MAIITKTSAHTNINTSSTPATTVDADFILINTGAAITTSHLIDGAAGDDSIIVGGATATAQTFNFGAGITNVENIVIGNLSGGLISSSGTVGHAVNAALVTSALNITGNAGSNVIQGGLAGDTISGNAGNDTILGNAGNDSINGGEGNDILNGGTGTDTLIGGAGNDIFVVSKGSDVTIGERIQGGTELDQIRFSSTTANDTLTLGNNVTGVESIAIGTGTAAAAVVTGTLALNVNASLVANSLTITGNAGANRITATGFDDSINGGAGNDVISAGAGNDTIIGGTGADSLVGGAGDDTYIYNTDVEFAFAVGESITDIAGNDKIIFNGTGTLALNNLVTGIDQITIGQTTASTNLGNVNAKNVVGSGLSILGNAAVNTIIGTVGNDVISGAAGNDTLLGGVGSDTIEGGIGADRLFGEAGNDFISNGEAIDSINGGAGHDTLSINANYVQADNAKLVGIEEIHLENSGSINLNLTGQTEGFIIYDNDYASTITGGSGNDAIYGDSGVDSFKGGAGNDTILGTHDDALIDGGVGNDRLIIEDDFTQANNAALVGIETIDVDSGAVNIDLTGQTEAFTINGNFDDDTITGGAGADTINGGNGNDTFIINSVANYAVGDVINGGNGSDTIEINVDATDADATIQLVNVTNVERVLIYGSVNINLDASSVAPTYNGEFVQGLEIYGNTGDNYITGTGFDDTVRGGAGNDLLVGGDGTDTLAFSRWLSAYTISKTGDLYTITDNVGNDGTDTFTGFESFSFSGAEGISIAEIDAVALSGITPSDDVIDEANEITGTEANEFANLGAGNDTADGGAGNDVLNGQTGDDSLDGNDGADTLIGGAGDDTLTGGDDDTVDDLTGSAGDDSYLVSFSAGAGSSDQVHENANEGTDTVIFDFFGYGLENNFENLILAEGSAAVIGIGNELNNVITGNSAINELRGNAGNDTLNGGDGDDTLNGGAGADVMDLGSDADESGNDNDIVRQEADNTGSSVDFTNTSAHDVPFDLTSADVVNNFHLNEDTFVFTFGLDEQGIVLDNSLLADNTYTLVYGDYNSVTHEFSASEVGNDTAVFYDADTDTDALFTASIVFTGVQLTSANIGFDII